MIAISPIERVKEAARGRELELLAAVGIPERILDGKHHPCPKCGGTDRFRFLNDEACFCNKCFRTKNGDVLAAVGWMLSVDTKDAIRWCEEWLGLPARNGKAHDKAAGEQGPRPMTGTQRLAAAIQCFTKERPPITADSLERLGVKIVSVGTKWRLGLPARNSQTGEVVNHATYRLDAKPFPQDGAKVKTLPRNKKNGWLWAGDRDTLAFATHIIRVEGPPDLATIVPWLPEGWVGIASAFGAEAPVGLDFSFASGKTVVVIGDADSSGQEGAAKFGAAFAQAGAASVLMAKLPYEAVKSHGKDLRDWALEGNGRDEFVRLVEQASPMSADQAAALPIGPFANRRNDGEKSPIGPSELRAGLEERTREWGTDGEGWPRRVGKQILFVPDRAGGVRWLMTPADLFAWIGEATGKPADWCAGACITKNEFFSSLCNTTQEYVSVEAVPHVPAIKGHFYLSPAPPPGDGTALDALLARFCPAEPIDADLIKAMFATLIWGGPPGARPMFLITSKGGRGRGKSKLAMMASELVGGALMLDEGEDNAAIKARLLSPDGRRARVVLLDNIKTPRFSWAAVESLITTTTISGKQMYVGEGSRPNTLTWILTLNGASLSTDMARRVVTIELADPAYQGDWESGTRAFIHENRIAILADLVAFFNERPEPLRKHSRWAEWEREILGRLPEPSDAFHVIEERQGSCDVDAEEADLIERAFATHLAEHYGDLERQLIHVPSALAANWLNEGIGGHRSMITTSASRKLKQLIDERRFTWIEQNPRKDRGRGFLWRGSSAGNAAVQYDLEEKYQASGRRA